MCAMSAIVSKHDKGLNNLLSRITKMGHLPSRDTSYTEDVPAL